jgi:biopolymer transport protein ExbB
MFNNNEMADYLLNLWIITVFMKGGIVMYPILLCSVFALAIIMERLLFLRRRKIIHPELLLVVRKYWQTMEIDKAVAFCKNNDIAMSRVLKAGLLRADYGILEIERAIEGAGNHEATLLNANLRGLGVIANLAPLLGLLGTVTGMIKAFSAIAESGAGNPSIVASGIAEALITTAAGLIVGIPTLAVYYYFKGRVDRLIFEMEEVSLKFLEELTQKKVTRTPEHR